MGLPPLSGTQTHTLYHQPSPYSSCLGSAPFYYSHKITPIPSNAPALIPSDGRNCDPKSQSSKASKNRTSETPGMGLWAHSIRPVSPPRATLHRGRGTGGSPETRPLHSLPPGSLSHERAWLPNARLSLNPVTKTSSGDWVPAPSMTTLSSKERSLGEAGQRQEEMGQGPGREKREPAFKERVGHTAPEDSPTRGGELQTPGQVGPM